jgi:hypothetical protein
MDGEDDTTSRKMVALFYGLVLAGGLAIYIVWGIMYGAWNILDISNIAMYSVFFVMVGAGVVGLMLYGSKLEIK